MHMIKILHIVSSLKSGGGVQTMLYNYYENMDRNKIHFDFVVHGDDKGMLEEKVEDMGSAVFHVTPKKVSLKRNVSGINEVIKSGSYDAVHCHQNFSNLTSLYLAWRHRVPVRISHAHGCKEVIGIREKAQNGFQRLLNKSFANYFFSCGLDAGKWLHGKGWSPSERNILMNNAIDVDKFSYNKEVRERYRKKLNIEDKTVLLHVGRFSDEKNHLFIVDIMEQVAKENSNYILLLAGNGATEKLVKKYVDEKELSNSIIFMGVRNDVAELMNAADIFLLPSKNEGFPVTLIEAQSTGVFSLVSEKVTKEIALTDLIEYLPINNIEPWVKRIVDTNIHIRQSKRVDIENAGYSITVQAKNYSRWLENLCELHAKVGGY